MATISLHTLLKKAQVNVAARDSLPRPAAAAKVDTSAASGTGSDTVTISLAAKVKQQQRPAENLDKQLAETKKAQVRERISDLKKRLDALWQEKLLDPAKQQHLADKKQLNTLTDELAGFYNLLRLMLQRKQPEPEQKKQQEAIEEDLQQIRKIATKLSTETSLPVTGLQERIDKLGN